MKKDLPRNSKGQKLYPVCNWNANQHKIDYWLTKAKNYRYDNLDDLKAWDEVEKYEKMLDVFDGFHENGKVIDGLVYAVWKDAEAIKEAIVCYDLCH